MLGERLIYELTPIFLTLFNKMQKGSESSLYFTKHFLKSVLLYFSIFVNDRGKTRKMIVSRIGAAVATEDANGSIMRNVLELLYTPTCNNSKRLCGPGNDPHCTGTTLCQHVLHGLRKIVFEAIILTVSIL